SPPSGPPRATCASRRKDTAPAPPSPALAWRLHSSTHWDTAAEYVGTVTTLRIARHELHAPVTRRERAPAAAGARVRSMVALRRSAARRPACGRAAGRT